MDCNSPEFLTETTEDSLKETEKYLAEHEGSKKVKTILAPRFAPTCSKPLIDGLGKAWLQNIIVVCTLIW